LTIRSASPPSNEKLIALLKGIDGPWLREQTKASLKRIKATSESN
jgi:hypothetical protein